MNELKPCPFCGETKHLLTYHNPRTILRPWYRIECGYCGAKGPGSDRGDHEDQWNRRALAQQPQADTEFSRLLSAVKQAVAADFQSSAANSVLKSVVGHYDKNQQANAKPLFADLIAQHPGLKEELAEMDKMPPANCRQRLAREGKPHPRNSCASCGRLSPKWQDCNIALAIEGAKNELR